MISRLFLRASVLTLIPLFALAAPRLVSELKNWPWHEATLLAGVSAPLKDLGQYVPLRRAPGAPPLESRLWKVASPRGLYLIIPGTGAGARSGSANLLAELANAKGYDALVLVNPFSPEFQSLWSSDGLIGFPQRDVKDAELMVRAARTAYAAKYGAPKEIRLLGFSLGATYTALLSQRDLGFPVAGYVLLNPPVDFAYAMNELDEMMRGARNDDEFGLFSLIGQMIPFFRAAADGLTLQILPKLREFTRRNEFENRHVIGAAFGFTLVRVTNGLKATAPFSERHERARMDSRLLNMSFERYMGLVGIALSGAPELKGRTFRQLSEDVRLSRILAPRKNFNRIVIVTNSDDFLIRDRDLNWLETLPIKKVYTFDGGGHCGNYWTPSFRKLFQLL